MGGNGTLFENEKRNEIIFEWCKKNSEKGPRRIANIMPLEIETNGTVTWHPLARKIIDEFGNQQEVLDELSANMGTYGTIGSRVPYLTSLKILVSELRTHTIPEVRKWADSKIKSLEIEIKLEELSNEEDNIS